MVSILVFVDLAFEGDTEDPGNDSPCVSILVFVDLAFEEEEHKNAAMGPASFNPCFRGSSFRRPTCYFNIITFLDVSILVFVDLAFEDSSF